MAGDPDPEYEHIAKPHYKELDFAFFVANFGYTKRDYDALTPTEHAFILKSWEDRLIRESYNTYNACFTAFYNANRPKRKKALKLWKKRSVRQADTNAVRDHIKIARDVIKKEGDGWADLVYARNGLKRPKREEV